MPLLIVTVINIVIWLVIFAICIRDIWKAKGNTFVDSFFFGPDFPKPRAKLMAGISGAFTSAAIGYCVYLIPFAFGLPYYPAI